MEQLKKNLHLIILLIGFLCLVLPLMQKGYFPMHDDTQPSRMYVMAESLRDGQFPVRWVKDLGYGFGYPLFNFYAPLPYYFGAMGILLGLPVMDATKLVFGVGAIIAGITMYLLGKRLWGVWGGLFSSLLYMYAPYHAVQLYVRGAVGEFWAYGFLPLTFLGLVESKQNIVKGIVVGSIGFAAVILSHNITAMILAAFLFLLLLKEIFLFFLGKKSLRTQIVSSMCVLCLGMGLSAFFWLPALVEVGMTRAHTLIEGANNFRDHFVFMDQLWSSPWGFAGSSPGRLDGLSFMIGKIHITLGIVALFALFFFNKNRKVSAVKIKICLIAISVGISILMLLSISSMLWELIPSLAYVQYPWRFLVFVAFFISLLGGSISLFTEQVSAKSTIVIGVVMGVIIIMFNMKYFKPQFIYEKHAEEYIGTERLQKEISKISDEYMPINFPVPQKVDTVEPVSISVSDGIIVEQSIQKSHFWDTVVNAEQAGELVFPLAHFLGWRYFVDIHEATPIIKDGVPHIEILEGRHLVKAVFTNTITRSIANTLSILSFGVITALLLQNNKGKINEKNN